MKYYQIFATNDKAKFNAVIDLFESFEIRYQRLHEYRLYQEKIHDTADEGAIIRVFQKDLMKANHLLISRGFKKQENKTEAEFNFIKRQKQFLEKVPILNRLPSATQFISITFISICLLLVFLTIGITRSKKIPLEEQNWCLHSISMDAKPLFPNTNEPIVIIGMGCKEYIDFHKDGSVTLPGFRTKRVFGSWQFLDKSKKAIEIFDVDNFEDIYEGIFKINTKKLNNEIYLESDKTKMILKQ